MANFRVVVAYCCVFINPLVNNQYFVRKKTRQLICRAAELAGFYMLASLMGYGLTYRCTDLFEVFQIAI